MLYRTCLVLMLCCVASACSTFSGSTPQVAQDGPPLVNGFYVEPGDRCGESCPTFGKWRATAPADVYAAAMDPSLVIGHIATGDWVVTAPGETHVKPLKGVVKKAGGGLLAGDIVYQLLGDGEGLSFDVWRKGDVINVEAEGDTAPNIEWEPRTDAGPSSTWWVRVTLPDGKTGWLRSPSNFDGMGPLS